MGFSSARPGSPSLGSCGPGREKTHFSHALLTTSIMPVGRNCLSSRLSLTANARAQGLSPEPGPVLGPRASSRGPACWQEITALSSDESPLSTTLLRQFGQDPGIPLHRVCSAVPLHESRLFACGGKRRRCGIVFRLSVRSAGLFKCCISRICCGHWSSRGGCIQEKRKYEAYGRSAAYTLTKRE